MDKVKRVKNELKAKRLISKEEEILKQRSKPFRADLIDLTLTPIKAKHTGSEAIIDARYEDIEKLLLDELTGADHTDATKNTTIKEQADRAKREETRRMKECYTNPDYMDASQRARDARQRMIEMLEERGITVDESYEF